ncbi:enoyl-CoA hydratase/isomerase family protein [Aeromicrobium sp. Leaf291]|uniref:enoyl-CoA hydratase/isomerase family protein n=1 Tax=Aeromicrobium sp. Leaf291 TaxID=1736325 RepID=UPI0006F52037|nr:enoyl-CoA hydratase/isomerase family protein [Aeromicrobium sp. Leaf291]KQP83569.1 hypothetical protein ASF35_00835 [Aeromicrobium sp. Leaf291]
MGALTATTGVDLAVTDDVATIVLARDGRANALDEPTVDALLDAVEEAEAEQCRLLVVRSGLAQFCGGFDLESASGASSAELGWRFLRIGLLLERLQSTAMLTIAVVDGPAVGAGADLAMACDVRLGTPRASLRFPGSAFGIVLGTRRLSALVGPAAAVRLASTGDRLDADEAVRTGLLDLVVEGEAVDREIGRIARSATTRRPATLGALKASASQQDPSGLADLARSLVTQTDLASAVVRFAHGARPTRRGTA